MDQDTGRVLESKNKDTPMLIASITKIMTCIVALENTNIENIVTVDAAGNVKILNAGETTVKITNNDYYVKMAVAWYLSFVLIYHYDTGVLYLKNRTFDRFIHNKAISKCMDSYRMSNDKKEHLKTFRY
jgi:hypothetical protein